MSQADNQSVIIYTDGACKGNPGPGGWGALLQYGEKHRELHGGEHHTTNNRMELMAAIQGLKALKRTGRVDLYTDSQYVRKGITEWMVNWKKNGWKTSSKKEVANQDLWQELDNLASNFNLSYQKVKGHSGDFYNEEVDNLAKKEAEKN
jgi:ribonuclease HI